MKNKQSIQVVDLFAGPGGLGEGFSAFDKGRGFEIVVSAEKDTAAHATLRLRAFYRLLKRRNPEGLADYYDFCNGKSSTPFSSATRTLWEEAGKEARCIELGSEKGNAELDTILDEKLDVHRPWVLIGGPPCQAYSLVGRARNRGNAEYRPEGDHRHFLYKEYLRILRDYQPAVFVMENVKGILSSKVGGQRIFPQILQDLASPGNGAEYQIFSLVSDELFAAGDDPEKLDATRFIIRAENHGVPQARHRVILLGISKSLLGAEGSLKLQPLSVWTRQVAVETVLGSLPKLRSRLSKETDSLESWRARVMSGLNAILRDFGCEPTDLRNRVSDLQRAFPQRSPENAGGLRYPLQAGDGATGSVELDRWFRDDSLRVWLNHETRGHQASDLCRYAYAAVFAKEWKRSPKGHGEFNLPCLRPAHKNWESGKFADRFRVQVKNRPSTTVTSHISKDGHYFIHYDPLQCRSLTVREAARLQTFPDNYFFQGNRTEQFHQVGNAVPPYLAFQIAKVVDTVLGFTSAS